MIEKINKLIAALQDGRIGSCEARLELLKAIVESTPEQKSEIQDYLFEQELKERKLCQPELFEIQQEQEWDKRDVSID